MISGTIKDQDTGEPLVGVLVILEDLVRGTSTDAEGNFSLLSQESPPFHLVISTPGYETRKIKVIEAGQKIEIGLSIQVIMGREVVVTASKIEESMLQAHVSIERLGLEGIRQTASLDAYSALANLKGVQMNGSSMTFNGLNTRGFSDMQNFRFIQLYDGVEMNLPGLNYAMGSLSAPPDLDLASFELVPGAGSALYGPNAFNGLLSMRSKSPFVYQGLSAQIKSGVTIQQAAGVNPFGEVSLRYAQALSDKFAFKITASALHFHDWEANDESFRISSNIAAAGQTQAFLNTPRNAPFFDAVNRYGDEVAIPVNLGTGTQAVHRTGIAERDLVDYRQQLYRLGGQFIYRPRKGMDLSYRFQLMQGDAVLRHTTIYPIVNFFHHLHSLELKAENWVIRSNYSQSNAGDSYVLQGTGGFIERNIRSNQDWGADYGAAYRGEVANIAAQDHAAARAYADRFMPSSDDPRFQELLRESLDNADLRTGGSKFVDKSSYLHLDGQYDVVEVQEWLALNVGGSVRRYNLNSQGGLFNDGALGFNRPIEIWEGGAYAQASKSFWDERLNLRASLRFDKNQNFQARLTPRISALVGLDKKRQHNLRLSYQTGFRNPANLESYINLDIGDAIVIGAVADNLRNYSYQLRSNNPWTGASAGTIISGEQIFNNLKAITSLPAVLTTGDTSRFVGIQLDPLVQEKINTYEIGYKSLINNKLFLDFAAYYNEYDNFMSRVAAYSPEAARVYSVYTNIKDRVWGWGANMGLEYNFYKNFRLGANYSYSDFNAENAVANNRGFLPAFNTPKHRANLSLNSDDVYQGLGFGLFYRWTEGFVWQSAFGEMALPSYQVVDLALTYRFKQTPVLLKLAASNLLQQEYLQVYGAGRIGSQVFLSILYEPAAYSKLNR